MLCFQFSTSYNKYLVTIWDAITVHDFFHVTSVLMPWFHCKKSSKISTLSQERVQIHVRWNVAGNISKRRSTTTFTPDPFKSHNIAIMILRRSAPNRKNTVGGPTDFPTAKFHCNLARQEHHSSQGKKTKNVSQITASTSFFRRRLSCTVREGSEKQKMS